MEDVLQIRIDLADLVEGEEGLESLGCKEALINLLEPFRAFQVTF